MEKPPIVGYDLQRAKALLAMPEQTAMYLDNRRFARFGGERCPPVKSSHSEYERLSCIAATLVAGLMSCSLTSLRCLFVRPSFSSRRPESWKDKPVAFVNGFMTTNRSLHPYVKIKRDRFWNTKSHAYT